MADRDLLEKLLTAQVRLLAEALEIKVKTGHGMKGNYQSRAVAMIRREQATVVAALLSPDSTAATPPAWV